MASETIAVNVREMRERDDECGNGWLEHYADRIEAAASDNSKWIEVMSDIDLISNIRTAMGEGCIHPSHVFDQIDELIQRFCEYQDIRESEVK